MPSERENCKVCVGPTREACDGIYAGIQGETVYVVAEDIDFIPDDNSLVPMEPVQEGAQTAEEVSVALRGLGCTLNSDQLSTAYLSETLTSLQLVADESQKAIKAEQRAGQERIEDKFDRLDQLEEESRSLVAQLREKVAATKAQAALGNETNQA